MPVEYGRLRAVLLEYLDLNRDGQVNVDAENNGVLQFLRERQLALTFEDRKQIVALFHEFYLERLIVPGNSFPGQMTGRTFMNWPMYWVTDHGKNVLQAHEYQPYNPEGFLARLRREISTVDDVIVRYLGEALGCLRADHLLSAAVMTGCAAEKAMLLLIEQYGSSIKIPADKLSYEKETSAWMISRKYAALWKRLEPQAKALPDNLGDDLHTILDRVFDLIRTTRNDAGHPTGRMIERETVHANLILFPGYCRRIYKLLDHFK